MKIKSEIPREVKTPFKNLDVPAQAGPQPVKIITAALFVPVAISAVFVTPSRVDSPNPVIDRKTRCRGIRVRGLDGPSSEYCSKY